jgi:hypothetical protein
MSKPKPKAKPRKPRRVWVVWNETKNYAYDVSFDRKRAVASMRMLRTDFPHWRYSARAFVEVLPTRARKGRK